MQKNEWTISLILFAAIYALTSLSTLSVPVFADENTTNMTNSTHLECVNQACVLVNNTLNMTVDLCTSHAQCINTTNTTNFDVIQAVRSNRTVSINLTHLECVNQACVLVNGTGFDLCTHNNNCTNMTTMHRACVNLACVLVNNTLNGTTIDECFISLDCQNSTTGGNGTNGSSGNGSGGGSLLPLAPPAEQTLPQRPSTLAGVFFQFARRITGFFAAL